MTEIEIQERSKNALTVTPTRITLKVRRDATPEDRERLLAFATLTARELQPIVQQSYRGILSPDRSSVIMRTGRRRQPGKRGYRVQVVDGRVQIEELATHATD
jgi:hypothetical protein